MCFHKSGEASKFTLHKYCISQVLAHIIGYARSTCSTLFRQLSLFKAVTQVAMPRLSVQTRQRILTYFNRGESILAIKKRVYEKIISLFLYHLVDKYRNTNSIADRPRRKISRKIIPEMMAAIDAQLERNDEKTSRQLYNYLKENWPDI